MRVDMFKWIRQWRESRNDWHPKERQVPIGTGWGTCFVKKQHRNYGVYSTNDIYDYYAEIKYSGRVVNTAEEELYECIEDGKIQWINKKLLSFPKYI